MKNLLPSQRRNDEVEWFGVSWFSLLRMSMKSLSVYINTSDSRIEDALMGLKLNFDSMNSTSLGGLLVYWFHGRQRNIRGKTSKRWTFHAAFVVLTAKQYPKLFYPRRSY